MDARITGVVDLALSGVVASAVAQIAQTGPILETAQQCSRRLKRDRDKRYRKAKALQHLEARLDDTDGIDRVLDDLEPLPPVSAYEMAAILDGDNMKKALSMKGEPDTSVDVVGVEDPSLSPESDS